MFIVTSGQIPNYRGNKHREEAIDRPAAWEEVTFKCVPLQEGEEDAHEVSITTSNHLSFIAVSMIQQHWSRIDLSI